MAEKKPTKNKQVTLKRTVTIKVIVTERFKQYLSFELDQSIHREQQQLGVLEERVNKIKAMDPNDANSAAIHQLEAEIAQRNVNMEEFKGRTSEIEALTLGSEFVQGTVDGFVNVSVGDNLYEKLGGMEILAEDGLVKSITPVSVAG